MKWLLFILALLIANVAGADFYFNSTECPTSSPSTPVDTDLLMCDDFDDGTYMVTCNGSAASCCQNDPLCKNGAGPTLHGSGYEPNDGWEMEGNPAPADFSDAAAECAGTGFNSDCSTHSKANGNEPCVDLFDDVGVPQTTGNPDTFCDFDGTSTGGKTFVPGSSGTSIPRCFDGGCNGPGDSCLCQGVGIHGHHNLLATDTELFARWYFKVEPAPENDPDYYYGLMKIFTFQNQSGGNAIIVKHEANSADGFQNAADGVVKVSNKYPDCNTWGECNLGQNQVDGAGTGDPILLKEGNWYYMEIQLDIGTGSDDGVIKMWIDDCGSSVSSTSVGDCTPGSETLRLEYTALHLGQYNSEDIGRVWPEVWSNWGADGIVRHDQLVVSKTRIGMMDASSSASSLSGGSISGGSIQ